LSLAEVRKLRSLPELDVISVYLNLFWWGATFMKHFKGGESYESFGTSAL
jgi:hypothetical protein